MTSPDEMHVTHPRNHIGRSWYVGKGKIMSDMNIQGDGEKGSDSTAIVPAVPTSPDANVQLALPPTGFTEDEPKPLEINGPHVITFGWGDHGRTGITKETYAITQLSPRPVFLTINE